MRVGQAGELRDRAAQVGRVLPLEAVQHSLPRGGVFGKVSCAQALFDLLDVLMRFEICAGHACRAFVVQYPVGAHAPFLGGAIDRLVDQAVPCSSRVDARHGLGR